MSSQALIQPFYNILIAGATINPSYLDCDILIEMSTSLEPDTFQVKIYNIDSLTQIVITKGALVNISIGYTSGLVGNLITGIITDISNEDTQVETVMVLQGIDQVIYALKQKDVHISINTPTDVINIIRQVCLSAGVLLNATLSGIILPNYTVENKTAYDVVKELAKRIGWNATAKNSQLIVSPTVNSGLIVSALTDDIDVRLTKIQGLKQNNKATISGYNFYGIGIPTLMPTKLVTVSKITDQIFGSYIVESVYHKYNSKTGYIVAGTLIEPSTSISDVNAYRYPTKKNLASILQEAITNTVDKKPTIDTGNVEQVYDSERLLTAKFGLDSAKNKSIVTPSIEADVGVNNVFTIKKPICSPFAGDGYGMIVPVYQNQRAILGFNRLDLQDVNILGFLWKKGWTIPEHDAGEFLIHTKNHGKFSMKENGSNTLQAKSVKIQVGSNGLTISKPSATDDGKLLITFDDGSELSYKNGDGWKLNTSGNVVINGSAIKLGTNATLGVARLNDQTTCDATTDPTFEVWRIAFNTISAGFGLPPFPASRTGKVSNASNKVKGE